MLYMVEVSHEPERCVSARSDPDDMEVRLLSEIKELAPEHGTEIVGGWAYPVGHRLWYIVEAIDAHSTANLVKAARLHHWNTVNVHPVLDHESFRRSVLEQVGQPA